jgi:tripartite-type tricarboxylate transporter receptor subunit TctC
MTSRREFAKILAGGAAYLSAPAIFAQSRPAYPTRSVRMVVGFPPGQSLDIGARIIAMKLTEDLKQTVFVDNKPGASGIISHEFVKNAAPDGYTLLMGSGATLAINPGLYRKLPYNPVKDFTPVILINSSPMYLVTSANMPVNNLQEMIAYVKKRPGQISYGSGGSGLTQHIAMEMLKKEADLDMLHIPYKGSPAMVTDLIAERVQFGFDTATSILPHAAAGRVKLLGISNHERSPRTPNVPTIAEQGLPGFLAITWAGLVAPAGTPSEIVEQLNAAVNRALGSKEVIDRFVSTGSTINGGSAADFGRFLPQEIARWGRAVQASGAQVD